MNKPELEADPRFVSNDKRVENLRTLIGVIEGWLKSFEDIDDAVNLLIDAGVPCGKVYNQDDILKDPHYNTCKMVYGYAYGRRHEERAQPEIPHRSYGILRF